MTIDGRLFDIPVLHVEIIQREQKQYDMNCKIILYLISVIYLNNAMGQTVPPAVINNGFSYEYLLSTKETTAISGNIYRSSKDTGDKNVIRIVDGPLSTPAATREMIKKALEDDRRIVPGGSTPRIVILKPGLYRISDFLTLRENTALIGTTVDAVRTTIELAPAQNDGSPNFTINGQGGFDIPGWSTSSSLNGVRPVIVVANTRNDYLSGYGYTSSSMTGLTEDQRLQVILSDGSVDVIKDGVSETKSYSSAYGFTNDIYRVSLRNIDITIPASASGAIGVLWRTAQQSFIEKVNINESSATSESLAVGGYAGFVAQGIGGGGHWRHCRITGTCYGVLGFVGQVTIMDLSLNNISGIPLYWSHLWAVPIFRHIAVNNCAHGLVFDSCSAITILDSQINPPPNVSEFSPIVLLSADWMVDWMKNVYLQNVKSSASHLIRKRKEPTLPTLPNGSNLASWETGRDGDTDHVQNQNGEAKATHWVSGSAVIDQVLYEGEELPTVHSSDFPGLDAVPPVQTSKLIWYDTDPTVADHTITLQAAIDRASNESADLVIPPGVYNCSTPAALTTGSPLKLRSNTRIFGIQYPRIECNPANNPSPGYNNQLWANVGGPNAFISTPDELGNVLLDGLWIQTATPPHSNDIGGQGMILFDWRCPARILNTQITPGRYMTAGIRIGKNASGVLLNCLASSNINGANAILLGTDCKGPIDFVAVNDEHARHVGIKLSNCSDFNFLCPQSEHTGLYILSPSSEPPTWATEEKSAQPREVELEDCKEIRFFNAAGGRSSQNFPDSAFVIKNCESIFAFVPKYNFPDAAVTASPVIPKSYLHTATITQTYGSQIETWIPFVEGYFAPTFGIGKRKSLVGRWRFDLDPGILKDSVGINDASGGNFSAVPDDQGGQALGPSQTLPESPGGSVVIYPKDRALDQESFSVSLRVKPAESNSNSYAPLLWCDDAGVGLDWAIFMNPSGGVYALAWGMNENEEPQATPFSAGIRDGHWHEVTLTYDGVTKVARLYVDTVAVGSAVWDHRATGRPTINKIHVGYFGGWASAGLFDDLRFWNYARSAEGIGLAGRWEFDSGNILKDSVGINDASGGDFSQVTDTLGVQALGPRQPSGSGPGGYTGIIPKDRTLDQKSFSVSLRVKPAESNSNSNSNSYAPLLWCDDAGVGLDWAIFMNPSGGVYALAWGMNENEEPQATPFSDDIRDGHWHEITLTYDSDTKVARLYVDTAAVGQAVWDQRSEERPSINKLNVGYFGGWASAGLFDDLRFWNYARSAEGIGLAGRWEFDSGNILKDSVGINDASGGDFSQVTDTLGVQALGPRQPSGSGPGGYTSIIPKDRTLDQKSFSVSLRMKPTEPSSNSYAPLLWCDDAGVGLDWAIFMDPSGSVYALAWGVDENGVPQEPQATPFSAGIRDGHWHQVTLTYDCVTKVARLYVDTVAVGSADWSDRSEERPSINKLNVGFFGGWASAGLFDDLRFMSYVLN